MTLKKNNQKANIRNKSDPAEVKDQQESLKKKPVVSEGKVLEDRGQEKSVISEAKVLEEAIQEKISIPEAGEFDEAFTATDSERRQEINDLIDNLTLFDDDLMGKVFDENIEAAELLLRLILERDDIEVLWVKGQEELKNPVVGGRTIRLDIRAVLGDGRQVNVEVQRNGKGSHVRRARFHSSMLDARMLKKNEKFRNLKDSYVIFICEHDKFGKGLPVYHVDRCIRETGELFEDGSHIIYVNGTYRGNDSIGQLMHDFKCKNAGEMHYKELAAGVRHFKETEEGREDMCEAVRRYGREQARIAAEAAMKKAAEEATMKTKIDAILSLRKNTGMSLEQAMDALSVSLEDRVVIEERLAEVSM